jgi:hypothetical protein
MRASSLLSILSLATLAAGCGSSLKAGNKDAAPGADVVPPDFRPGADAAENRDVGLPDAAPEAGGPDAAFDAASDAVSDVASDLAPPSGDLALEARPSDLPPADVRRTEEAGDAATDLPVDGPGLDATVDATPPSDGGLAEFCTGEAPRMVVNGVGLTPTVSGYLIAMDCCDGGELVITNDSLAFPVGVGWLAEAGPTFILPITFDLANPPAGWRVQVIAGCSVTSAGCVGPHDYYQSGLQGRLTVARDPGRGYDTSVCVHVEENPAEPANLLHALDLYVPHVTF